MTYRRNIYSLLLFFSLYLYSFSVWGQEIKVSIKAPEEVWKGDKFRIIYVIESDGDIEGEFKIGNIKGLEIVSGPTQSTNSSISLAGRERKIKYVRNISYVVSVDKSGKYNLPKGEFISGGKKYKSEAFTITVKSVEQVKNDKKSFVRTLVSRTSLGTDDTLSVTYRLYTTMDFRQILQANYPSATRDFYVGNASPSRLSVQKEEYEGKMYNVLTLRRIVLQPRTIGLKKISAGSLTIEFGIRTGRKVQDFFGTYEEVLKEVQTLPIEEVDISVQNLVEV